MELIVDEKNGCVGDPGRQRFLADVLEELNAAKEGFDAGTATAVNHLRVIRDSIDLEFQDDPVAVHIRHCIEELEHLS